MTTSTTASRFREVRAAALLIASLTPALAGAADCSPAPDGAYDVHPVEHASFVLVSGECTLAFDPVGGAERFAGLPAPDLVLVSDVHGDHADAATIAALAGEETTVVVPRAVAEQLGEAAPANLRVLGNGESLEIGAVGVEAIAMYNLTEGRLERHPKGRGNGYVVTIAGKRFYVSGDTEDIPEMRALEGIDAAFVCMNLPYTMTVEAAADAVLEMRPRVVYPYHYRGQDGLADVARFAELVAADPDIEVRQLDWYPARE
jgi:L-ascorbate metabolism protein UlaG (beta-lactamase superfamily)